MGTEHQAPRRRLLDLATLSGQAADANSTRLRDDKATCEMISVLLHQVHYRLRHGCSRARRKSKKENTHNPLSLGVHKLAKILVLGDDYPFLARRHATHLAILCAWKRLADRDDIKAGETESP